MVLSLEVEDGEAGLGLALDDLLLGEAALYEGAGVIDGLLYEALEVLDLF
jgi:hypothetical protein